MGFGDFYDMEGNPCTAEEFMGLFNDNRIDKCESCGKILDIEDTCKGDEDGLSDLCLLALIASFLLSFFLLFVYVLFVVFQEATDNHADILRLIELGELT